MKRLLLLFCVLVIGLQLQAQSTETATSLTKVDSKTLNTLNRFSVTATLGTPSFSSTELKTLNFNKLSQVSLGDLNISYKMNSRMSFGIGTMGSLGNGASGYYNAENNFTSFCDDDDDHDDDLDDMDDIDDEDDDEDCDDDEIGQNLMGSATYKLSNKFPLFFQAAGGYSFSDKAPVYTAMLGYNQKIFAGFGIMAGIRFSDVLHQKPADAVKLVSPGGFKAELGLSWNF